MMTNQPATSFKPATRQTLLVPSTYGPAPHAILASPDLSPAAKLVYFALLDHLGNVGTTVWPGEARLARLTALSISSVRRGIRQLEAAGAIDTISRPGRTPGHRFGRLDPPPPAEDAGIVLTPPAANPGQIDRGGGQFDRRTNIPKQREKQSAVCNPSIQGGDVVDDACTWEELLGLENLHRSDVQDVEDFASLHRAAKAARDGHLGAPGQAKSTLSALAHQIGRRSPRAKNPLAMFLAEVHRMRLRTCRRPQLQGAVT